MYLGNGINFGNITSATSRTAAGKFIGYPCVAIRIILLRDSLRYAILVMHADIVVLIQKLSKSIRQIILSLIRYNVVYPSTYSIDHFLTVFYIDYYIIILHLLLLYCIDYF